MEGSLNEMAKAKRKTVPKFRTESEEAEWWDNHRETVSREFVAAGKRGELKRTTYAELRERVAARPVTIRLAESDIELARKQAERKGLPYQSYIKSLLHETLVEREGSRSS
jgi:predicted DNA binding CopG/RHH family protein